MAEKVRSNVPECCEECTKWEQFGKNCWVYWEKKKECTMHSSKWGDYLLG